MRHLELSVLVQNLSLPLRLPPPNNSSAKISVPRPKAPLPITSLTLACALILSLAVDSFSQGMWLADLVGVRDKHIWKRPLYINDSKSTSKEH